MIKMYNFNPGPSKIPEEVLHKISKAISNYEPINSSILEITHRSNEFAKILENIEKNLIFLLNIPREFQLLLLQGGATFQNAFIPHNISNNKKIGCLVNGHWSMKTYKDFSKVLDNVDKFEIGFEQLNTVYDDKFSKLNYLHVTSNETIDGIQIRNFSKIKNSNLILDMSSDIGSYKFNFDNISYLYAGAQKNLGIPGVTMAIINKDFIIENNNPSYLNLNELMKNKSLLNTPSTFSIFVLDLILEWMVDMGGLDYFENKSIQQSNLIYDFLDYYKDIFLVLEKSEFRSRSNITFNFRNIDLNNKFLEYSKELGIVGINGHRSVGGVRVSLYNSITDEMVKFLLDNIEKFLVQVLK